MDKKKVLLYIVCEYVIMSIGIALALVGGKLSLVIAGLFLLAAAFPFEVFKMKEGGELKGKETLVQYIPFGLYFFAFIGDRVNMFDHNVVLALIIIAGIAAIVGEVVIRKKRA